MLSYGPCQFPTLGFIVDRYKQIRDFTSEKFWSIVLKYPGPQKGPGKKGAAAVAAEDSEFKLDWQR